MESFLAFLALIQPVLTAHDIKVNDVSDKINAITAPKLYRECKLRKYLLVAHRNAKNNLAISMKTQNEQENVLVVYKNQFRCFNCLTETDSAVKEIEKMIIEQQ